MYSPRGYRKHKRGHDSLPCQLLRSKEVPQGKGMEHNYWLACKVHWLIHMVRNEYKIFPPQVGVLPAPECRKHLCMAICRCQEITAAPSMMSGIRNSLSLGFSPSLLLHVGVIQEGEYLASQTGASQLDYSSFSVQRWPWLQRNKISDHSKTTTSLGMLYHHSTIQQQGPWGPGWMRVLKLPPAYIAL